MANQNLSEELLNKIIQSETSLPAVVLSINAGWDPYHSVVFFSTFLNQQDLKYDLIRFLRKNKNNLTRFNSAKNICLYKRADIITALLTEKSINYINKFFQHEKIENKDITFEEVVKDIIWYVFETPEWFLKYGNHHRTTKYQIYDFVKWLHETLMQKHTLEDVTRFSSPGLESKSMKLLRQLYIYNVDVNNISDKDSEIILKTTDYDGKSISRSSKVHEPTLEILRHIEKEIISETT